MRLKSTLTFVAIAVLAFGMIFATSATQIDKVFARPVIGEQNHVDAMGSSPSDIFGNFFGGSNPGSSSSNTGSSSSSNPDDSVFGNIFGNFFNPSSSNTPSSTDKPSSSNTPSSTDNPSSSNTPSSTDKPTSSTDPKDQPCKGIKEKGAGTKDYYCFGTHTHCVKGESPGCVLEGGRT
jgi:hypothetical protein